MTSRWHYPTRPVVKPEAVGSGDQFRFSVLTDGVVRYEWAEDGKFEDRASSFAIMREFEKAPSYHMWMDGDDFVLATSRFYIRYNVTGGKFNPDNLRAELRANKWGLQSQWRFGDNPDNLGGTIRTLDRVSGRSSLGTGVLSKSGFASIDDSKSFLFEDDGWYSPRPKGDRIDGYLFGFGRDYQEAINAFHTISGRQPLIPRWALGNWWSRYHPYTDTEYLDLMDKFQSHNIPLSVGVLDMNWHRTDVDKPWTGYSWDRKLIPNPEDLLSRLHERKLRVTLNDHPHLGVRSFEEWYEKMAKKMGRDSSKGQPLQFDCTDRNFVESFLDVVAHGIEDQGCDFWWLDWQQGRTSKLPGVDPLWILNHYHYLDHGRNGDRPLNFTRWPGPGGQRYPVGFSGDTFINWESLAFQPEFTATASNIGYGWWSHDIGGHMHGYKDDELTTRWVQYACFSPILRLHYSPNPFVSREPWDLSHEANEVISDTMRFRHRLIPYLYTMSARATYYHEPLVRPMYWDYSEEDDAYTVPNQYMFGTDLMVAPITSARHDRTYLGRVDAWLPRGRYVDISNGLVYSGGRKVPLHRSLKEYPVLAREGSVIPLDGAERLVNGGDIPEEIELILVVGKDGVFELVEDDGQNTSVSKTLSLSDWANQTRTFIYWDQASGTLHITPTDAPNKLTPSARRWRVCLMSHTIREDMVNLSIQEEGAGMFASPPDSQIKITKDSNASIVDIGCIASTSSAKLEIGSKPQLDVNDISARCWPILFNTEALFDRKIRLWNVIKGEGSVEEKWSKVQDIGGLPAMLNALEEILFADYDGDHTFGKAEAEDK